MTYASMAVLDSDSDGNLRLDPYCRVMVGGQAVVGARQAGIASPTGGEVVDEESRAAIGSVIAALQAHGLIE